jgi:hypothetical protein
VGFKLVFRESLMFWRRKPLGMRLVSALIFLLAALALGGCTASDKAASVSGKVTYNGKPVTSGVVVLVGKGGKASDPGQVQDDGTYSIAHAPTGTVKVSFDNPPPYATRGGGAAADEEAKEAAAQAKKYVATPPKYKDPDQSGLTFELKVGRNDNCDLPLR